MISQSTAARSHGHRDVEGAQHDAGVEIHIGVQVALHKVLVVHSDPLQLNGNLKQGVVAGGGGRGNGARGREGRGW